MGETREGFEVLHEFVAAARARLPAELWDYLVGGAETETTLKRNRHALDALAFRPRVLRDVSSIDLGRELFGARLRIPVLLAPIGSLQNLVDGGSATAARGAARFGTMSVHSSVSEPGLEGTAAAATGPKIFQLYVRGDAAWVDDHVRRAVDHGYVAFCLTVDLDYYGRRERDLARRYTTPARRAAARGEDHQKRFRWDDVRRIRDTYDVPLVIKGIATAEDASIACELGIDAVYVSNHGGRQLDHGRAGIEVLPEVVQAVGGRARVIVDGGFMRGTDVIKALALGADAVGVGRLYGLAAAAAGEDGIVRALELLEEEMRVCMGLLGVDRLAGLGPQHLHPATPVGAASFASAFPLIAEGY